MQHNPQKTLHWIVHYPTTRFKGISDCLLLLSGVFIIISIQIKKNNARVQHV